MTQNEWTAILTNDKSYDGQFYCACKTTRVVCRPSCRSKMCKRENIVIFYSLSEAIAQGYHPCQKCCPQIKGWKSAKYELAAAAGKYIEDFCQEKFSLDRIADELHVNKYYLTRVFKEVRGQTLLSYHHFCRCEQSKQYLKKNEFSVEMVAYKAGYMTSSHYVRTFHRIFGITPLQYRRDYVLNEDSNVNPKI